MAKKTNSPQTSNGNVGQNNVDHKIGNASRSGSVKSYQPTIDRTTTPPKKTK